MQEIFFSRIVSSMNRWTTDKDAVTGGVLRGFAEALEKMAVIHRSVAEIVGDDSFPATNLTSASDAMDDLAKFLGAVVKSYADSRVGEAAVDLQRLVDLKRDAAAAIATAEGQASVARRGVRQYTRSVEIAAALLETVDEEGRPRPPKKPRRKKKK